MTWAANAASSGPLTSSERLVLIAMAEPADVDGHRSFLSVKTLGSRTGISERQVVRLMRSLETRGHIIRAADQGPAQYLRVGQRPVVYDLALRKSDPGYPQVSPLTPRDVTPDTQAASPLTPMSDEPTTEPNYERPPKPPAHQPSTEPCSHGVPGGGKPRPKHGTPACPQCRNGDPA